MESIAMSELFEAARGALAVSGEEIVVRDAERLRESVAETLAGLALSAPGAAAREAAQWMLREAARALGIWFASLEGYYSGRGKGYYPEATVPAVDLREPACDVARGLFRAARARSAPAMLLEFVPSEAAPEWTPSAFSAVVAAAAIREGVAGPVFLQATCRGISAERFEADRALEMEGARGRLRQAMAAGIYNYRLDTASLLDPARAALRDRYREVGEVAAELTHYLRSREPDGLTVGVGARLPGVDQGNSTAEEVHAFMSVYLEAFDHLRPGGAPLVKLAPVTGRGARGVLDLEALGAVGRAARASYGLAGAIQDDLGALSEAGFECLPPLRTCELVVDSALERVVLESGRIPAELAARMVDSGGRPGSGSRFRGELRSLSAEAREGVAEDVAAYIAPLLARLKVEASQTVIEQSVRKVDVAARMPPGLEGGLG